MPHRLQVRLQKHVPNVVITRTGNTGGQYFADGIISSIPDSKFTVLHQSTGENDFFAFVRTKRGRKHGRRLLNRFNGAFGSGSEKPRLIYNEGDFVVHEYWSKNHEGDYPTLRKDALKKRGIKPINPHY